MIFMQLNLFLNTVFFIPLPFIRYFVFQFHHWKFDRRFLLLEIFNLVGKKLDNPLWWLVQVRWTWTKKSLLLLKKWQDVSWLLTLPQWIIQNVIKTNQNTFSPLVSDPLCHTKNHFGNPLSRTYGYEFMVISINISNVTLSTVTVEN